MNDKDQHKDQPDDKKDKRKGESVVIGEKKQFQRRGVEKRK